LGGGLRDKVRTEKDRKPKAFMSRRNPFAAQPAAAACLAFSKDNGPLANSISRKPFDDIVRGCGLFEDLDIAAHDPVSFAEREEIVCVKHVRNLQEAVAVVRTGLNDIAERAEFFDPRPDGSPGNAELVGEVGAGDRGRAGGTEGGEDLGINSHEEKDDKFCNVIAEEWERKSALTLTLSPRRGKQIGSLSGFERFARLGRRKYFIARGVMADKR
jgi:hypothetical protein